MGDRLVKRSILGKLVIRVDGIEVAAQPRKVHDVCLSNRPTWRAPGLTYLNVVEIEVIIGEHRAYPARCVTYERVYCTLPDGHEHSLLVVGSIAFDSIETPFGTVDDALGGSATFFSYAASFFVKPRLVGVVGEDFPDANRRVLTDRGIDMAGLVVSPGKTFRWKGRYHQDMNTRDTLEVHLNVFGTFDPRLPESFRDSTHVFLANGSPVLQAKVLDQVKKPHLVLADTMDLWIETQKDALLALLPRVDGLLLNDSEAQLLTGEKNIVRAGNMVMRMGPKFVILKKGEHGAMLFSDSGVFVVPAYPTEEVLDPTGAGDSFAGGILGYLASDSTPPPGRLRRAMAYGTVVASLTVEGFGLDRLKKTERREIDDRLENYKRMLDF